MRTTSQPRRYAGLSDALADKKSPLRIWLDATFPHRTPLQETYRSAGSALIVPNERTDLNDTIRAAFDLSVRFWLDPTYVPSAPMRAFTGRREPLRSVIAQVITVAGAAADARRVDDLHAACWSLALCSEVYDRGLVPGSELHSLILSDDFSPQTLLALTSRTGRAQLLALHAVADSSGFLDAGDLVSFESGDAGDVIKADTLFEIKVDDGAPDKHGIMRDKLDVRDILHLITFALLDTSDALGLSRIGVYSARYGTSWTINLTDALTVLADAPVSIPDARRELARILTEMDILV